MTALKVLGRVAFVTLLFLFIFALLGLQLILGARPHAHHPPAEAKPTPIIGVGFDLGASYGTAALSYPNGSNVAIAKVEADSDYREMIKRLCLSKSQHQAPPFQKPLEPWGDWKRHWWREIRKKWGFPATNDVGTLSRLITTLKTEAEEKLGHTISAAVVVSPHPIALYQEDIDDALDFAGLQSPFYAEYPSVGPLIDEGIAAYAGNGLGICANEYYKNWTACQADLKQHSGPEINLTAVVYTKTVLSWSTTVVWDLHWQYGSQYLHSKDFELGSDARADYAGDYWSDVRTHLRAPMLKYWRRPNVVLVLGESVHEEGFLEVLKETVGALTPWVPDYYVSDAVFAAAKGAAEFGKRAPFEHSGWRVQ